MSTKTDNKTDDRKPQGEKTETPDPNMGYDTVSPPQVPYPTVGPDDGSGQKPL